MTAETAMNQPVCRVGLDVSLLLGRLTLGLYFLLAGVGKITSEGGVQGFVEGPFSSLQPEWLPDALATPYGYALPYAEVVIGALFMVGFLGRLNAALIFLMLVSFTIALAMKLGLPAQGPDASGPFKANYIFIPLAMLIFVLGSGRISLDALFRSLFTRKQPTTPENVGEPTTEAKSAAQ